MSLLGEQMDSAHQGAEQLLVALRFSITLLGAVTMYLFSLQKGFHGSSEVLEKLFPARQQSFYYRVDFLLSTVLGAILGTIIYQPSTSIQALAAGLGWVGAVNILAKKKP